MTNWIDIGPLEAVRKRGARIIKAPGRDLAVFRTIDDDVFALVNACPYRDGPLSEGIVHGRMVTDPLYNWVISLETGLAQGADEGSVETFPVKVENGRILLDLETVAQRSAA
ncbi:nitrite reductase small subunit NirD [Pelagimonas varians]|uniref:Assimilatory nitrite reductase [NAD(P)H] small subunit n=1 Tax=Pelagimonas varians TaxID=696760 RepID=A0A238K345_9RHOB|nr:nitrite reductase small subunit NirD [Pelagimonas varians]PYG33325.1 assimilatory nitrite reductase (NAD(P)H) small subunit [Pelagimonas varians]SMX36366.1 Assimilatory nitrite reductase [NAD(P)H] small subunit [Pelagimonas varians]